MKAKRLFTWISDIWRWINEGQIVFITIIVLAMSIIFSLFIFRSEVSIRTTGYILQLIGMILAIRGLTRVREYFGHPPFYQLFIIWCQKFPKWRKSYSINLEPVHFDIKVMNVRLEEWLPDNPDQPIERRIEGIVKNLERIRKEQSEHAKSIEELRKSQEEHKKRATEENKIMEEQFQSNLETLHTSDLLISLVGLVWLTFGITMSTMAPELARWVK